MPIERFKTLQKKAELPLAIEPNCELFAVFFNRLGEIRDRSFEQQRYRASGLNLVSAAIILWNTVYLDRAIQSLKVHPKNVDDELLKHLSPLGWEHINLTGDYVWRNNKRLGEGKFRPLRRIGDD